MHKRVIFILILLMFSFAHSFSQEESISVDVNRGCDELEVSFNLDNARGIEEYRFGDGITWNFGDGETAEDTLSASHIYKEPGLYFVSCDLGFGGDAVRYTDTIIVSETPYADFNYRRANEAFDLSFVFTPVYFKAIESVSLSYLWTFPDDTNLTDSIATYTFADSSFWKVQLSVSDENGCTADTIKTVSVFDSFQAPNVFTPNGDGLNDYFKVAVPGDYNYDFRIYSRDGLQVFYSLSNKIIWDGYTIGNNEAPEGIYYYTISSVDAPEDMGRRYSGYIYLYRYLRD